MRWRAVIEHRRTQACRRRRAFLIATGAFLMLLAGNVAADQQLGINPIFGYAENGDTAAVGYLLGKGQSVEDENLGGETVLNIAAADGHLDMVELAISNGGRIDHPDHYGKTALCWAAERGHYAVVERLIKGRADIDHQTQEGLTPLMLAIREDRAAIIQLLLGHKPNLTVLDYTGRGALGWARAGRDRRLETMLVRAGAKD
jgi:ankyrin repeat protein